MISICTWTTSKAICNHYQDEFEYKRHVSHTKCEEGEYHRVTTVKSVKALVCYAKLSVCFHLNFVAQWVKMLKYNENETFSVLSLEKIRYY